MGLTANVEYFYRKCNEVLKTNYTAADWGGDDNAKKAINVEWVAAAAQKVYQKIHSPKTGYRLLLSARFNPTESKLAVPVEVVNSVVEYLRSMNKPCDNDCACYRDLNCNCVCTCPNCACQCNCNCACECGNNTECVCDCQPYDCNCNQVLNCNYGNTRPMTENCGTTCVCNCNTFGSSSSSSSSGSPSTCNCYYSKTGDCFNSSKPGNQYSSEGKPTPNNPIYKSSSSSNSSSQCGTSACAASGSGVTTTGGTVTSSGYSSSYSPGVTSSR